MVNMYWQDGDTALHWASFRGHKEITELLLSHPDIEVNSENNVNDILRFYFDLFENIT